MIEKRCVVDTICRYQTCSPTTPAKSWTAKRMREHLWGSPPDESAKLTGKHRSVEYTI
jgi:hypothetical protein